MLTDCLSEKTGLFAEGMHTELRAQCNRVASVSLLGGDLTANLRRETAGVSARVFQNGVYGFSSMAELSPQAAEAVLRAATENAAFLGGHVSRPGSSLAPAGGGRYDSARFPDPAEQRTYIDFARELDERLAKKYPGLASRQVLVRDSSAEKLLYSSDGGSCHSFLPRSYVYLFMSARTAAGEPVELFKALGGYGSFEENFRAVAALEPEAEALYEKLMAKREGVYPRAGLSTVILGGGLAGILAHEAVGHTVEADLVRGGSVAASCLGRQVASEKVSLTDFAHSAFGRQAPLPVYMDDEGVPATDAAIIRNGILVGYMNSRETAAEFGMTPAGNARAYDFSDEPLIRMRNTAIHPGSDSLEDMIASVDEGYYLVDTAGGQADTTGEFMFGVSMGYEIKNGKLGRAILDTTITGVAFEMLKTVDMVTKDICWSSSGYCGKKQPMPVSMGGPELRCRVMIGGR